jgi:hypothetical protein
MDSLSLIQVLELIRVNEAAIVTQFQTWLTITFATIVAVFAGKDLLTFHIKWLVTGLYLSASITITGICIYLAESNVTYTILLEHKNIVVASPLFASIALFLLVLVGIATTCYFIHMQLIESNRP